MAINPNTGLPDDTKRIEVPGYLRFGKIITWLVYAWIIFGVSMLAVRVFLLLASANVTGFVEFVYRTSADFLQPFSGIFPAREVGETGFLDVSAVFAILVYLIIAWLVSAGIKYIQSKIDDLEDLERQRAERNRKRLEQQRYAAGKEVVRETTYVRKPKTTPARKSSSTKKV